MIVFIINILILGSLSLLFYKVSDNNSLRHFFWSALAFKVVCGLSLGLLYKTYYSNENDTFFYFEMASELVRQARHNPLTFIKLLFNIEVPTKGILQSLYTQPRALIFVKFLAPINFLTKNSYWLSSIYFSLFSFYGCFTLAGLFTDKFSINKFSSALAFLFFPSFVFWSSGVMKESLMLGLFGILIPVAIGITTLKSAILRTPILLLSGWILWQLKYYFAAILIPLLLAYILFKKYEQINFKLKLAIGLHIMLIILGISVLHPNLNLNYFPRALFDNYLQTLNLSDSPDYVFKNFHPDWASIITNSPLALITGLFRPFIWECELNLQLLAGLENLFLLTMFAITLSYLIILKNSQLQADVYFLASYVIVLATLLAFASPNFGTLLRYKTGFMPFFIILITHNNPAFCYLTSILERKHNLSV